MLKAETREAFVVFRPVDTFRAQCITGAHHVEQIPAGIAVLPAVGIRVIKVAIKDIAADFVVKTDIVITDDAGARHAEGTMDLRGKFRLDQTPFQRDLRGNTGDHHRFRFRQIIVRRAAINH